MNLKLTGPLTVLTLATFWALGSNSPSNASPLPLSAPGGGKVIYIQEQLLDALDSTDFEKAAKLFHGRRDNVLVTGHGLRGAGRASGQESVRNSLSAWYTLAEGITKSRILEQRVECSSENLGFGVFRIERRTAKKVGELVELFDVTTLVTLRGTGGIFHMHVSRVDDVSR